MKKILLIFCFLSIGNWGYSQVTSAVATVSPNPFEENQNITITFTLTNAIVGNVYLWAWAKDANGVDIGTPNNGSWGASSTASKLTQTGAKTYIYSLTPSLYYSITGIKKLGCLAKTIDGSAKSIDFLFNVGSFQATLTSPAENSTAIITSGQSQLVTATNTNGNANYTLLANGTSINTSTGTSYSFTDANIVTNKSYELQINQGATTFSKKFNVIVNPSTISEAIPAGLEDGINYNLADPTKATLVLDAPLKDFVYVAGTFNNYQPGNAYAMKKDISSSKFWLELTGLTSGQIYNYQYWVVDTTPIAGTPTLVKTADPYSTLVLSPFDDPYISPTVYPSLPMYPTGQEREVSVLQTAQTPYAWSAATTNFVKPSKDNLIVYEALVRDFDSNRSYQDLINRISYFKNLNINAIELMPVMEFEGNESWGYNTSFHLAPDKAYGPPEKLKEFIDLCHQNGIAVILDVALNHAFGRNPLDRMWMNDPDGDGWGGPSSENPYFNTIATHSYSVGNDFNHQQPRTQNYVKRVIKQWIQEYKIDGFRWDLTKGFTQNCPSAVAGGQDNCTNTYQQDRVDVLKSYADYSWSLDPTHYIIFEHLGNDNEEVQWANYRIGENPSKGVMMWGKMTDQYNQLTMGYNSSNDISRIGYKAHTGFIGNRVMGYPESHDEERLMYKNVQFGNSTNPSHNVKTLNVALSRMSALGAMSLLVPGPKMIWHFGDLGWELSIYTCSNGTINDNSITIPGDCKLDNKPQPQWVAATWLADINRNTIYNNWAKMNLLKKSEPVFSKDYTLNSGTTLQPKIYIYDNAAPISTLKNVVVLSNFDVNASNVVPNFPYTGTWYNLMDNTSINIVNTTDPITIEAGGFRVYGNQLSSLGVDNFNTLNYVTLSPNPASTYFTLSAETSKVQIYSITGQLVKSFNANQPAEHQFSVSDLGKGMYLVKAFNANNEVKVMKLLKN